MEGKLQRWFHIVLITGMFLRSSLLPSTKNKKEKNINIGPDWVVRSIPFSVFISIIYMLELAKLIYYPSRIALQEPHFFFAHFHG